MTILRTNTMANGGIRALHLANQVVNDVMERTRTREKASDLIEEGLRVAKRRARHGRHVAEDFLDQAAVRVRRQPLRSLVVAFTGGVVVAVAAATGTWLMMRK